MTDLSIADVGFAPRVESELSPEHARRVAAVLDCDDDMPAGRPLPLLWHWAFFATSVPTAALGNDGHPRMAPGGPTAALPRRMWAGGRVTAHGDLVVGEPAIRRSRVLTADRKSGRSGELLVVTVGHEIEQRGRVVRGEEQDLVYRAATGAPVVAPGGDERPTVSGDGWCDDVTMQPPLLFRYSAVTFNSHRIHYDEPYATGEEGYPGLVVHGPLTATLLAGSAVERGHRGTTFEFRATAPLFAGLRFSLVGEPDGDGVDLRAIRNDGAVAMSARLR